MAHALSAVRHKLVTSYFNNGTRRMQAQNTNSTNRRVWFVSQTKLWHICSRSPVFFAGWAAMCKARLLRGGEGRAHSSRNLQLCARDCVTWIRAVSAPHGHFHGDRRSRARSSISNSTCRLRSSFTDIIAMARLKRHTCAMLVLGQLLSQLHWRRVAQRPPPQKLEQTLENKIRLHPFVRVSRLMLLCEFRSFVFESAQTPGSIFSGAVHLQFEDRRSQKTSGVRPHPDSS